MLNTTIRMSTALATGFWVLAVAHLVVATIIMLATSHREVAFVLYAGSFTFLVLGAMTTIRACMESYVREIINAVEINRDLMPGPRRPGPQRIPIEHHN